MSNQITKRQHFVPQFYLRKFSQDKKRVHVYDKTTRVSKLLPTREVAQEHYFYDLSIDSIPPEHRSPSLDLQTVEHTLSHLENDFSNVLTEFLNLDVADIITAEQRQRMARFLSFQYVRTRDFRNFVIESDRKLMQTAVNYAVKKKFPGREHLTPRALDREKASALMQNRYMFDIPKAIHRARILEGHIWIVGENPAGVFNYTSDSPIVTRNISGDAGLTVGFAIPGAEVIFPLSPERVLLLREHTAFKSDEAADGRVVPLSSNQVEEFNKLQVVHAERQVFSLNGDFNLIEDMLRSDPDLFSASRERITISENDPMFRELREAIDERLRQMEQEDSAGDA